MVVCFLKSGDFCGLRDFHRVLANYTAQQIFCPELKIWYFEGIFHAESEYRINFCLPNHQTAQNAVKVAKKAILGSF